MLRSGSISLCSDYVFDILVGSIIGLGFKRMLQLVHTKHFIVRASFLAFYLLQAVSIAGVSSSMGTDDLVTSSAGTGFNHDGWFRRELVETRLPYIIDLLVNSNMFSFSVPLYHGIVSCLLLKPPLPI